VSPELTDGVCVFVDFVSVGVLVVAVAVGVWAEGSSSSMVGTGAGGELVDAAVAVALAAWMASVVRPTVDERPASVMSTPASAVVVSALGICAGLEGAVGPEVARTVAVIVMVTCAWAPELWVPTRLMAAVARAAIESATASHPAARAAA
jgi:hypothetical protein